MAKTIQSKSILDRRQLLATAAAISTSRILPKAERAKAGQTAEAVMVPTTPVSEAAPLNVCAATARRIEEIAARNRIRQEACLPLLSIPQELRRMKEAANKAEFEAFAHVHQSAVWAEILAAKRESMGDPKWRPRGWMDGLAVQAQVDTILHRCFVQSGTRKVSTA